MRARHAGAMIAPLFVGGCILVTDLDSFSSGKGTGASEPVSDSSVATEAGPLVIVPTAEAGADVRDGSVGTGTPTFVDDFNRANGGVGNGWIEGQTNVWSIEDNHLKVVGLGLDYTKAWLYRPKSEALRDLTASVEFTPTDSPPSFPQVHVRITMAPYQGYGIGVPADSKKIFWVRTTASTTTQLGEVTLSESIAVGRRHRLYITAVGHSPVELTAKIEREIDGGWKEIGVGKSSDNSNERLGDPGQLGLSTNAFPNYTYDNFTVTNLQP